MRGVVEVKTVICPLTWQPCVRECMWLLEHAPSDVTLSEPKERRIACAIAVFASHVASETHHGGNFLMKTVFPKEAE